MNIFGESPVAIMGRSLQIVHQLLQEKRAACGPQGLVCPEQVLQVVKLHLHRYIHTLNKFTLSTCSCDCRLTVATRLKPTYSCNTAALQNFYYQQQSHLIVFSQLLKRDVVTSDPDLTSYGDWWAILQRAPLRSPGWRTNSVGQRGCSRLWCRRYSV